MVFRQNEALLHQGGREVLLLGQRARGNLGFQVISTATEMSRLPGPQSGPGIWPQ